MTRYHLKIIAIIAMTLDHLGAIIYPDQVWLRIIGRIAFPIFAFFIAEGFYYTKNIKKYLLRISVFAIITEPVFDYSLFGLIYYPGQQNVMFTFLIALLGLWACDRLKTYGRPLRLLILVFSACLAQVLKTDYGFLGPLQVFIFYFLRNRVKERDLYIIIINLLYAYMSLDYHAIKLKDLILNIRLNYYYIIQAFAIFSLIPIHYYNEKEGKKTKYLFYFYYPLHLLVIGIIKGLL